MYMYMYGHMNSTHQAPIYDRLSKKIAHPQRKTRFGVSARHYCDLDRQNRTSDSLWHVLNAIIFSDFLKITFFVHVSSQMGSDLSRNFKKIFSISGYFF